jgi:hypothetical protein
MRPAQTKIPGGDDRLTDSFSFVYAEHFQPGVLLLGSVPEKVRACDVALLLIALSEIDQTRALRAKEIHPKA